MAFPITDTEISVEINKGPKKTPQYLRITPTEKNKNCLRNKFTKQNYFKNS